jgi:Protein of unknown function (DUF4235)
MSIVFRPVGILLGILAGIGARKIFDALWGVFSDEEAPNPEHREIDWVKFIAALLLEGAIFRLIRGLVDHHSRRGWAALTGVWPGQEEPEPE